MKNSSTLVEHTARHTQQRRMLYAVRLIRPHGSHTLPNRLAVSSIASQLNLPCRRSRFINMQMSCKATDFSLMCYHFIMHK